MAYKKIIKNMIYSFILMSALLTISSMIGLFFRDNGIPEANIVIIYIFAVFLTARYSSGFIFGILASILATLSYNYFFTAPFYSLSVKDPYYFITFIVMTITALITSALTSSAKQNEIEAQHKEKEASALYRLTNRLSEALNIDDIVSTAIEEISNVMNCEVECLCFNDHQIMNQFLIQKLDGSQILGEKVNGKELMKEFEFHGNRSRIGSEYFDWPIYGQEVLLGILRIKSEVGDQLAPSLLHLMQAMNESTALAMDRFNLSQEKIAVHEEVEQERYRSNLLRAISHDLRTPLSAIIGTSEMMMDMSKKSDPRYDLASDIHQEANWLHSLVENILSLTRLQSGKVPLHQESEVLEEIIGSAVYQVSQSSPKYEINVHTPEALLLVKVDAKLIEQVIINLLDNAIKHSPNDAPISITLSKEGKYAKTVVRDHGTGISEEDFPKIFEMFYSTSTKHADAQHGMGLGLTICSAIVKVHGGDIKAYNVADGQGAEFMFTLPLEEAKDE
ncbi:MAG: DUF4118 domain-containing protein [Erysipelotrichaceae bacterium]